MKGENRDLALLPFKERIIDAHGGWPAAFQGGEGA